MAQKKYLDSAGLSKFFENIANTFSKKNHTHTKSQITDFPSSMKNPNAFTIKVDGVQKGTYDGSEARTLDFTSGTNVAIDANSSTGKITISSEHSHSASEITDGILSIARGGTGATDANGIKTNIGLNPVTTSGTSSAYTATVPGITALTPGARFIMLPHVQSTVVNPTLNVNGLGDKLLRVQCSNSSSTAVPAPYAYFLGPNRPVEVMYNGIMWVAQIVRPEAGSIYGTVKIENGGTGAKTAEQARQNLGISTVEGTMLSQNADYAEVGEWADGNPKDENRIGYFVAIDNSSAGSTMVKAASTSDVRGVTVASPAFSGNCADSKFDIVTSTETDQDTGETHTEITSKKLKKQYDYVAVMGIVSVIDNGTCEINGKCMPADDGTAVPSPNNMGYQIIDRIDDTHVLITVEPSADMMVRIKDDVADLQKNKADASHNHDGRYYTESEIDNKIASINSAISGKAASSHKHVKADISDFPTSMPASDVSTWAKAATKPTYTKSEVGLGNVDNTADANKSVKYATSAGSASTATTANRVANTGVGSADVARHVWFSDNSIETARVSDDNFKYNPSGNLLTANISGNAATASSVAWGNVTGKPSSFTPSSHTHDDRYYTESEIDSKVSTLNTVISGKAASSHKHTAADITSVNASAITGVIDASHLPSYVDDVLEGYYSSSKFYKTKNSDGTYATEIAGEAGKIYTDLNTNKIYRWSGSAFAVISDTIALGETSSTAYRGDRGKIAYDHSQKTGNPHGTTKADLGLGSVENKSSATIRGELTKANVTTALGYTPPITNTTYPVGSPTVTGTTKLYTGTGTATDGTMTQSAITTALNGKSSSSHNHDGVYVPTTETGTNAALNRLSTGSSDPTDDDYYIAQYAGGGTTTTTYHRRPVSALWNYIKSKADTIYAVKSHSHNYAGSSSAGGAATSANKLNTNAGSGTQPVYFSNGIPVATTYTLGKSVPNNAVFTDTTYSDVTTSTNGLMTAADKTKLNALGDIVTITKSITLKTGWVDTGISGTNLDTGTYVVQVRGLTSDDGLSTWYEIWSGVMSWYASGTNGSGSADEILLHNAGHADNGNDIYLRTLRNSSGVLALQIAAKDNATKADNITFKFRKLI